MMETVVHINLMLTLCVRNSRKSHQERPIGLGGLQSTRHPVYSTPKVIQATIESNDATSTLKHEVSAAPGCNDLYSEVQHMSDRNTAVNLSEMMTPR